MKRVKLALSGAAAMLAGCTVGPNYTRPEIAVPASYAGPIDAAGATVDPARWWEGFGDARLNALIARALADNPDIAIAASRVRAARLQEIIARASGRPVINGSTAANDVEFSRNAGFSSLARQFSSGNGAQGIATPGGGITTIALGFDSSWEIDLFGGARRGVEGARARGEAAVWSRRDAAITIVAEVADAYFALRLDQAQIALIEGETARLRGVLEIAGRVVQAGLTPSIDVPRQRGALSATLARIEPVRADAAVRIHALGVLTGQSPEALLAELSAPAPALGAPPAVPAGLPSDLLRRRPDVRAAERRLAGATADIGVAVASLYPKFTLTGTLQLLSSSFSNFVTADSLQSTAGISASFPILDWGRRKANVGLAKEAREQAYLDYKASVLRALRDVEDPLSRLDAERRRRAVLAQALADARASAGAIGSQYRTGFVARDALLNAEVQALAAEEQLAASDALIRQHTAALFKAIGGGWDEPVAQGGGVAVARRVAASRERRLLHSATPP